VKVRSKDFVLIALLFVGTAIASQPGDKRTILTSGESVHTIHYQLGQSTILYLGTKPETVICGNKNYFNIEKIKEGITVQPLANFSTNLTILDQGRRYLFYLTPAAGRMADTFVDVKWISQSEVLPIEKLATSKSVKINEINQRVRISKDLELVILRQKVVSESKRRIFEVEIKNQGLLGIKTERLAILAMNGRSALTVQTMVWEEDEIKSRKFLKGRLIVGNFLGKPFDLVVRYRGYDTRATIRGIAH